MRLFNIIPDKILSLPIALQISKQEIEILSILQKSSKTFEQITEKFNADVKEISNFLQLLVDKQYIEISTSDKGSTKTYSIIQEAIDNINEIEKTIIKIVQKLPILVQEEFEKKGFMIKLYSFLKPKEISLIIGKKDKEYSIKIEWNFS